MLASTPCSLSLCNAKQGTVHLLNKYFSTTLLPQTDLKKKFQLRIDYRMRVLPCMARLGYYQVCTTLLLAAICFVSAQDTLDPVRNNMSLPQVGLSILTSLSAIAGAFLKGELRAETSHKDLFLLIHPFTFDSELTSSKMVPLVRRFALWLERQGFDFLKSWYDLKEWSPSKSGCLLVESPRITFSHWLMASWFWLNCSCSLRVVAVDHPAECDHCLRMPSSEWSSILDCLPVSWVQFGHKDMDMVVYKCIRHGGTSMLSGILGNPFEIRKRVGILLPIVRLETQSENESGNERENVDIVMHQQSEKECLTKAFCTLDRVERNLLSDAARTIVATDQVPRTASLEYSAGRRMTALVLEIGVAMLLSWGGQIPPLSASLVGRRLVRSQATGGRGNSSLFAGATGNEAHVNVENKLIAAVEIFSSVSNLSTMRWIELTLVVVGVLLEYVLWMAVLMGVIPRVLGAAPGTRALVAKACLSTLALIVCCLLCCFKNLRREAPFVMRGDVGQLLWILGWHLVSQLLVWLLAYTYISDRKTKVVIMAASCALFGETMWLTAMWSGAHHPSLSARISCDEKNSHHDQRNRKQAKEPTKEIVFGTALTRFT